jgi:hypothetical protein
MTGGLPDLTTAAERSRNALTIVETELDGLAVSDDTVADLEGHTANNSSLGIPLFRLGQ